jgi:hypothetical protein
MSVRNLLLRMPVRALVFPGSLWPSRPNYPLTPAPPAPAPESPDMLTAINLSGATIAAFRVVAIDPATGGWVYADSTNPDHAEAVLAVTPAAIINNASGTAANGGEIVNPAWSWTIGQTLWLGSNGLLSRYADLPPGRLFDREICVAKSATAVVVDPEPAVLREVTP